MLTKPLQDDLTGTFLIPLSKQNDAYNIPGFPKTTQQSNKQ